MENKTGKLFILAGPSAGVGKTTLMRAILKEIPRLTRIPTATTRTMREGETNAIDYFFISDTEFDSKIATGGLIEWIECAGYRYGTLRQPIEDYLKTGEPCLLVLEPRGVRSFRKIYPDLISIFIMPPSFDALRERMLARGRDTAEEIENKLTVAREEIKDKDQFDYIVLNDNFATAVAEIKKIIESRI